MKNFTYLFIILSLFTVSCGSAMPHIFGKKTPHERYEDKLKDTGIAHTPEGRLWLAASQKAITDPVQITVPYKLQGYFHADKPRALGLTFQAKQGEQIVFTLSRNTDMVLYADLYKDGGMAPAHLLSAEKEDSIFILEIKETGNYILRIQPEISSSGEYGLSVNAGPSLGFPVSGAKARIGSFWGDSRDGGKRDHEGIDIFAPKRTPVVAIADGYISSVRDGGLGGKTVSLKPVGTNYSLYYAHLDEQLVQPGQFVKKGAVLGLVGNTGNARTTPPHLHFGIYTSGGAVDPFPFVNKQVRSVPSVPKKELNASLKVVKALRSSEGSSIKVDTRLVPLAVTSKGYIAESPEGNLLITPFSSVKTVKNPVPQKEITITRSEQKKEG